ncbi:putative 20S rRNA accumulation protein 4 [Neolecta irregularis DAH-3]|uniref:Putative 20S rRNA accumulation protein 4 n=1 Tax=Neolecta irregularis (strain DAH-3) TaxID=1198029 RepID=A0A1U7LTQ6_NEOID|nr:putative 20S rRNA accumulation protein 4 [Neolecta irregularis DAH-3]|eukprot:OLL26050.1 putative 20S rRNA accumulation protein 4 [Neolecta irregularis DAH-3]
MPRNFLPPSLGFVQGPLPENEVVDIYANFLGGSPVWVDNTKPPDGTLSTCSFCNSHLVLLVQLYVPVGDRYDRIVYVFCCKEVNCHRRPGSFCVFRRTRRSKRHPFVHEKATQSFSQPGTTIFDSNNSGPSLSNPFVLSNNSNTFTSTSHLKREIEILSTITKSLTQSLNITSTTQTHPAHSDSRVTWSKSVQSYPCNLLYFEDIPAETSHNTKYSLPCLDETSNDEWAGESYEKSGNFDKEFQNFTSFVSKNPSQCIHYNINATPRHFSNQWRGTLIPACPCGSNRRFEFQIMPRAVDLLDETIDWGTIIIATCAANCSTEHMYAMEWVLIEY